MGGHQAGETASALAVVVIEQFTLNTLKWFFASNGPEAQRVLSQFQKALRDADQRIVDKAAERPELTGMGTTLTVAYFIGQDLCIVHVGDSRAYVWREGELHQLTRDHTLMEELVRKGQLRPDEVAGHRLRHVITNVVGGPEAGVEVEAHALQVEEGDRLLLCSDGLTEMVPHEAIAATLMAEPDPEAACAKLLAQANDAGGRDNITAVVVRFDPVAAVQPPRS
jgi:protein phosphatase